jgi:outer membrane protein assembly factor BamD
MIFRKLTYYTLFATVILLSACNNEYRHVQKSRDTDFKYDFAMRMFEEGRYARALQVFEEIQPFMRGRENFPNMTFVMAQAYYRSRDYFMAGTVFQNYARLFPNSERAEEAFFMGAYCMMLDVPYYKLDQASAHNAIRQFQLFINYYSTSPKVQEANQHIDALRLQLARKAFALANNYYRRSLYLSASISFKNVMKDFPETAFREQAMYMNVKSLYYYAHHSIRNRQVERFTNTLEAFEQLERSYPESLYISQLQNYITRTNRFLERHNNQT